VKRPGKKTPQKPVAASPERDELSLIRKLADMLNTTGLSEIELDKGSTRIRVSRGVTMSSVPVAAAAPVHGPVVHTTPATVVSAPAATSDSANDLKSPMVGTAYLSPSPGAPAFAAVGSSVKEGQTVLIIEAMKTMNQIHAHKAGKIVQVLVDNGQPVEFGERLMVIE
jgi:acetyl-CoA carboxylase biotin carboxyl carrier protein